MRNRKLIRNEVDKAVANYGAKLIPSAYLVECVKKKVTDKSDRSLSISIGYHIRDTHNKELINGRTFYIEKQLIR